MKENAILGRNNLPFESKARNTTVDMNSKKIFFLLH